MNNHGGRANEPTSYGLQPPRGAQPPVAPEPAPGQGAGAVASQGQHPPHEQDPARPYGQGQPAYGPGAGQRQDQHRGQDQHPGQGQPHDQYQPSAGQRRAYEPTQFAGPAGAAGGGSPTTAGADAAWTAAADPDAGRLIGGRYRLVSRLGHGGMGTVWKAHDQIVDRDVAVKEPRVPDSLPERERQTVYQRMQREARAAARIDHPAVVTVHDVVVEDGRPWIVMELVRGRSLGDVLADGTLDPREAARIGVEVLGALAAAHEAGVLHRDVKPDNVLLGRLGAGQGEGPGGGRVVLTDFGIAQVEGEQGLTETGAFIGSPEFIAPERVLGQRPGPESDLWSLGVVLYAAVEGMSPFRRTNHPATLQAVLSAEPQTPARGSGALGTLIMQLLRKEPAARPTAAEARQVLESVARPAPQLPTMIAAAAGAGSPAAGTSRLPGWLRGRKAQLGLGSGVLAVAVAVVMVVVNPFGGSGDDAPAGWKTVDAEQRVRAELAAPEDYTLSEDDDEITLLDPGKVFTITLNRDPVTDESDTPSALQEANSYLDDYQEDYYEYGWTEDSVEGSVRATTYHGKKAAELTATYTTNDSDSPEDLRRREFHYMNDSKVQWQLVVEMPAKGKPRAEGERLFKDLVKHLRIKDL
ncbi:serine/threonine-protein kinase [Streptomyces buecherae]|uniref:serine/threonine-protein kinase n=1 Tax=Streptomyces buecherae TaxID=2763006 RepID=UPI001C264EC6|nr:serine/threonine-protein kinase [Streptomyces buecherae]